MKKVIYYFGVYALCINIHQGLEYLAEKCREHEEKEHHKKNAIGVQPTPAKKPMNKIGFESPQA